MPFAYVVEATHCGTPLFQVRTWPPVPVPKKVLVAAGHALESITHIIITHIHPDHANGLVDAAGAAPLPVLAYSQASGLGQIMRARMPGAFDPDRFKPVMTS